MKSKLKHITSTHLFNAYRKKEWIDPRGEEGDVVADIIGTILNEMKRNKVRLTPKRYKTFKTIVDIVTKNEMRIYSITPIRKSEERYTKSDNVMAKNEIIINLKVEKIKPITKSHDEDFKVRTEVRKLLKEFMYGRKN